MSKEISERIEALRREYGKRVLILGHYYQRDEVFEHTDFQGDSLELSRKAAEVRDAEKIVFCGVHFMAESAAVLAGEKQSVFMPDITAGCPMADMATEREAVQAFDQLTSISDGWLPIVYVNTSAAIKAWCGKNGGSTCTSSNAPQIMKWATAQNRKILFLPDEHLGRNTAFGLGFSEKDMAVFDPQKPFGGIELERLKQLRILLWKGYCNVHQFSVEDVRRVRGRFPDAKIIVHPESPREVVALSDAYGSTSQIIRYCNDAPSGSTVVIGTEINMVMRLAKQHRVRLTIVPLRASGCKNMALTDAKKLLALLESFPESNRIVVPDDMKKYAQLALKRMLDL
jgi:quinolinate synthase